MYSFSILYLNIVNILQTSSSWISAHLNIEDSSEVIYSNCKRSSVRLLQNQLISCHKASLDAEISCFCSTEGLLHFSEGRYTSCLVSVASKEALWACFSVFAWLTRWPRQSLHDPSMTRRTLLSSNDLLDRQWPFDPVKVFMTPSMTRKTI